MRKARRRRERFLILVVVVFGLGYFFLGWWRSLKHSPFFFKKDRLNLVLYGQPSVFYSFGLSDGVSYRAVFGGEILVQVPGGYGWYKLAVLDRLARLEKKPALIQKAFSSLTSTSVDFYFFAPQSAPQHEPSMINVLILPKYRSNASFFDRLRLFLLIVSRRKTDFINLKTAGFVEGGNFDQQAFAEAYKGYFYQKTFREESVPIRIMATSYSPALTISRILEGEGIRVVDITTTKNQPASCILSSWEKQADSATIRFLSAQLQCTIKKTGRRGDTVVILGRGEEKEWE